MLSTAITELQKHMAKTEEQIRALEKRIQIMEESRIEERKVCSKCNITYTPGNSQHYCTQKDCGAGLKYWDPDRLPI